MIGTPDKGHRIMLLPSSFRRASPSSGGFIGLSSSVAVALQFSSVAKKMEVLNTCEGCSGEEDQSDKFPVLHQTGDANASSLNISHDIKHGDLPPTNRRPRILTAPILKHMGWPDRKHNQYSSSEMTSKFPKLDTNRKCPSNSEMLSSLNSLKAISVLDRDHNEEQPPLSVRSICQSTQKVKLQQERSAIPENSSLMQTSEFEEYSLPTSFGKLGPSHAKRSKLEPRDLKNAVTSRNSNSKHPGSSILKPFDICQPEKEDLVKLKASLIAKDKEKGIEVRPLGEGPRQKVLRPGMVLLKNYITLDTQISLVRRCRDLGLGPGGFYQPGYNDGAKLRLQMMCLGLDWDPQTRRYSLHRQVDGSRPPAIPQEFQLLVHRAIKDSHSLIEREFEASNAEDILPSMSPDICIVNFYSTTGRLGLHQDRDERAESLAKGLPVVSFSIGDAAEFLYSNRRAADMAEKVVLESGDVLVFGGHSRLVFHGVQSILPNSAPNFLLSETKLRPGRLNLTFRQY
ncbi:hypothetical protein Nepgr_028217 [Nepenthes gracilis]|uniref:DNA N(6)-methyladenine demethylase n=1 Tax=Nepenthes gracilis TaxID=150966 RepID=A0AAD3TCE6_NEPGR|nr:hypothetical protein Nepgr_028217 [Nepenthes gracilis]